MRVRSGFRVDLEECWPCEEMIETSVVGGGWEICKGAIRWSKAEGGSNCLSGQLYSVMGAGIDLLWSAFIF